MHRLTDAFRSWGCGVIAAALAALPGAAADDPFAAHGRLRVAASGTHLEHADGTPFFFLADTCWCGPALSGEADWDHYLADRRRKGFTAIQFNMVSPWRAAPTDAEGRTAYTLRDGAFRINEEFYARRLDARLRAINRAGMLAVPVLCWANKAGDAGIELPEPHLLELVRFEVDRYRDAHVLWILAGDNSYQREQAARWQRIGRAVFGERPQAPVTTHPTGQNWPWDDWEDEQWLTVLGYQSGHGDGDGTWNWIHHGPPADYGRRPRLTRPAINLEPPYEGHLAYQSRRPHPASDVRRAVYWSLLLAPVAGVTYGGHGVWSWHDRPGKEPTDHAGSGPAMSWREALGLPGSAQVGHARRLFESLPWTRLRPAQQLLARQEQDPGKFVACAATPDRSTIVAYLPAGAQPAFHDGVLPADPRAIRWFNPRDGRWLPASPTPPDAAEDRVLVAGGRPAGS